MKLGTPQQDRGQIVERSYGWCDGEYYMRVFDRSDRTTAWFIADAESRDYLIDSSYDAGGALEPPTFVSWTPCEAPQESEED